MSSRKSVTCQGVVCVLSTVMLNSTRKEKEAISSRESACSGLLCLNMDLQRIVG